MAFEYTFRGADMPDLAPKVQDLLENRDQELELYLANLPSGGSAPSGSLTAFAGSTSPSGWLLCDGSVVSQTTYASLYATIGATYNTGGEGAGNFRLPNIKGRVIVGRDTSQTEFNVLGETGGAKTHTLTTDQMPSHSHFNGSDSGYTTTNGSHTHTAVDFPNAATQTYDGGTNRFGRVADPGGQTTSSAGSHNHSVYVNAEGGSQAHNNLQPYIVLNWIIKT